MMCITTGEYTRSGRLIPILLVAVALVFFGRTAQASVVVRLDRVEVSSFPFVRCALTVTESSGATVAGLGVKDFGVTEDGRTVSGVNVSSTIPGKERIEVALVIDRSGSMRGAPFRAARSAAAEFISRLSDQDLLSIVFFSTRVGPSIAPTTDRAVASDVLESTRVGGETALFDAVENSVSRLSSTKADRRALVLLTDGRDNSSSATESKCESSAERDHVTVYCIGLGQGANADALRRLAEKTGGSFFATASPDDLAGIYRKIAGQIRNRYTLTYRSPASDRKQAWHTVGVQVRWKGLEAASVGQYLRMTQADSSGSDSGWPEGLLYPVVAGFVAVDMTLAGILLWRRRRARRR